MTSSSSTMYRGATRKKISKKCSGSSTFQVIVSRFFTKKIILLLPLFTTPIDIYASHPSSFLLSSSVSLLLLEQPPSWGTS